jgi:hypothetical protein
MHRRDFPISNAFSDCSCALPHHLGIFLHGDQLYLFIHILAPCSAKSWGGRIPERPPLRSFDVQMVSPARVKEIGVWFFLTGDTIGKSLRLKEIKPKE